ncbi:transcriptional regulator [Pseudoroseomonas aestuarii]|uniref:Transcriptional regulator n=2 Tax=Teichococcus aestuarii TaxID=568898 RepID=A0A2U1V3Z5_9PROT|nr:transcriptional regulator [Pseudoroseomonas aestuarii]
MPAQAEALQLQASATQAAALLRQLASEPRLLLLCHLTEAGEMTVGALTARLGLSQPGVSQHLARLREDGLVVARREGTTLHYRVADPRVARLLALLRDMFCTPR